MKIYLQIIFLLLMFRGNAQVSDNFNDGDFINSPVWSGNDSDFNVNTAGQLQLNAAFAGNSFLSLSANLTTLDSCEWHFYIHLDFSPSTSNYCRIYLSSDQSDLRQPLNGYYLQFGESLSNDAIELFRQDGINKTSICRSAGGMIATAFSAGVKVQRNNSGSWTIAVDYNGGTNYIVEATGNDITYNGSAYIGLNCAYTSGNTSKFFFDDFYAGPEIPDTILPNVSAINVESDSRISILLSEAIDSTTLFDFNNYSVDNSIGHPLFIERDSSDLLKYFLSFINPFQPGNDYNISFSGLRDLSQNMMNDQSFSFSYSPDVHAQINDIIFSEIYFEPATLSPLPNAEYIEIYNRRDSTIILSGWKISDGGSDGLIPTLRLGPHEYLVLRSENDSLEFLSIPNTVAVSSFPTLNNDVGDDLRLTDGAGLTIDELKFSNTNYHDSHKDDGGWSVERVDHDFTCKDENNWKASISNFHGTPGKSNSVEGFFSDETRPFLINAFLTDSNKLSVVFSEDISNGLVDVGNYKITNSAGDEIFPSSVNSLSGDSVELFFANPFLKGIYSLSVSSSLRDCSGNEFASNHKLKFGFDEEINSGDVILNELMFDCFDGGNDFFEIYNRSEKIVDLIDWFISETDFVDSTDIKESTLITKGHRLFFPGEYLVFSEDEKKVKQFYNYSNEYAFMNVKSMPDFNSSEGRAVISDKNGNTIDAICYSADMHFPLLAETRGVSLERLSFEVKSNEKNNWHSAAATAGFATPGYGNSQQVDISLRGDEVSVGVGVFSPDDDGYNDVLSVHYHFPQTGTVLSLNVYDYNGQPVRTLLSGTTVSNEGVINWDGLTNDRTIAPSGIYILFARSFDLDGNNNVFKETCFLTRKY